MEILLKKDLLFKYSGSVICPGKNFDEASELERP